MKYFPLFLCLILGGWLASGCGLTGQGPRDVEGLLANLSVPDSVVRDSAVNQLPSYLFLKKDLPQLYAALERPYPDDSLGGKATRTLLLHVLGNVHDETTPDFLRGLYPTLPSNHRMQEEALMALASMNTSGSLEVLRDLLLSHKPALGSSTDDLFRLLHDKPRHLGVLYPALFPLLEKNDYTFPLLETLSVGLEAGAVAPAALGDSLLYLREVYRAQKKKRDHLNPNNQMALTAVALMEATLRCLAYLPEHPIARQILDLALRDEDPFVQLAAAKVKLETDPSGLDSSLVRLAADFRTRNQLYLILAEREQLSLFPKQYLSQPYFAESDLADWLAAPANRSNYPKELQLMRSLELPPSENEDGGRLYLFKFSYGRGWQVGLSGPQPLDSAEVSTGGYLTVSRYSMVDALDQPGHIFELLGDSLVLEEDSLLMQE